MLESHFYALIPLLVMLIMSLVFYGKGLVHLLTLGYCMTLAWFAIVNSWEIMFYPVILIAGIISIILFAFAMTKGDWL